MRALLPIAMIAALFAVLATAPIAVAQDPSCDQYCPEPTEPGNDPAPDTDDPVQTSGGGSDDTNDGGSSGATGSTDSGVPPTSDPSTAPVTGGGGNGEGSRNKNNDDRTLDGFAVSAENQRDAQTAAQLGSQTSTDDSSGIGWYVWVALGLIVLWAIAMGVKSFRGRRGDGEGSSAHRSGEQQTA